MHTRFCKITLGDVENFQSSAVRPYKPRQLLADFPDQTSSAHCFHWKGSPGQSKALIIAWKQRCPTVQQSSARLAVPMRWTRWDLPCAPTSPPGAEQRQGPREQATGEGQRGEWGRNVQIQGRKRTSWASDPRLKRSFSISSTCPQPADTAGTGAPVLCMPYIHTTSQPALWSQDLCCVLAYRGLQRFRLPAAAQLYVWSWVRNFSLYQTVYSSHKNRPFFLL